MIASFLRSAAGHFHSSNFSSVKIFSMFFAGDGSGLRIIAALFKRSNHFDMNNCIIVSTEKGSNKYLLANVSEQTDSAYP
jgi:hypothetical protein